MYQVEILLELLRAAVLERQPVISNVEDVDWEELMKSAAAQGLLAFVWDGICMLPKNQQPPRQSMINWGLSAQDAWDNYDLHKSVLEKMVSVCQQNGLRLLLLKGMGLSALFPKPQSRPAGDIDIYLFDDYDKGNLLFCDRLINDKGKHSEMMYQGVFVENHNNFLEPNTRQKKKIIAYIRSSLNDVRLSDSGYYVLEPMANCVFLAFHTLKHFYEGDTIPIRNVLDFAFFLKNNRKEIATEKFRLVLKQLELSKGFELLVCLSEQILKIQLNEYHFIRFSNRYVASLNSVLLDKDIDTFMGNVINRLGNKSVSLKKKYAKHIISKYIPRNVPYKSLIIRFVYRIVHGTL